MESTFTSQDFPLDEYIRNGNLSGLKHVLNKNHKLDIADFNIVVFYHQPEIFVYFAELVDDESIFTKAMIRAMDDPKFFESLILQYDLDPSIRDGLILTIAKQLRNSQNLNLLINYFESNGLLINFDSEDEIGYLADAISSQAEDQFIYPIGYVYDPEVMIKYGFLPTSIDLDMAFSEYVTGTDIDTIRFWYGESEVNKLLDLNYEPRWSFKTLESHKHNGITSAFSLPLILYAPELVYKGSKRPITDMALFRSPFNLKIKRSDIINNIININGENWKVIPVTRYSKGMSRGLYYKQNENEYCGTFYYYEPESTTLLAYKSSRSFFNKYIAIKALNSKLLNSKLLNNPEIEQNLTNNQVFQAHINGILPRNLMLTPSEYVRFARQYGLFHNSRVPINETKHYVGKLLSLYALEDSFDQPLCEAGKHNNLDIIILESMTGSHQIVTEILDTRARADSFKSLIYIRD